MSAGPLEDAVRTAGRRIVAALAARYRDLDIAEDAFADACARALEAWPRNGVPSDQAAWLFRVADRRALDALRRRRIREGLPPDPPDREPTPEDVLSDDALLIPDERLRLIFVCCHPALAPDVRAALTLRVVCGLSSAEIARAFLVSEPTLAQRLVRAKRKIADAGVPFDVPAPNAWPERLDAVLSTLEIAYSKAHEDAAGAGAHAGYAAEMLDLTTVMVELMPNEPDVLAFAALVRYAEARRPARLDPDGVMVPLADQDPRSWIRPLIEEADGLFGRSARTQPLKPRVLQAAIHGAWCGRLSLAEPPPWPKVLALYDVLLAQREDVIVRLNRVVALAEVRGVGPALDALGALDADALGGFLPFHAVRADLLRRSVQSDAARAAYDAALALDPAPAERLWLVRRRDGLSPG